MEPLPPDCPEQLSELINACRSFEPFLRPTAGGKINEHIKKELVNSLKITCKEEEEFILFI